MSEPVARHRPKMYPPPEFPPRRAKLFGRTPPVVFPVILGLLGLVLALRAGLAAAALPAGPADLLAGVAVALWVFAVVAYGAKLLRRPGAIMEDLRVLPARGGIAAATMGGMAVAAIVAPFAPTLGWTVLVVALVAHVSHAALLLVLLWRLPAEARVMNPTFHMTLVGPIVGGIAAAALGNPVLASLLFVATLPIAAVIWAISILRLRTDQPPAPLRPLLAIHLAPAAVLASVAGVIGQDRYELALLVFALIIAAGLLVKLRWIMAAGMSPLWGAFSFPLAALTGAMLGRGGAWAVPGLAMLAVSLATIPALVWLVLKDWPGGKLAARTNAAEA